VPSPEGFEDFVFGNGPVKEGSSGEERPWSPRKKARERMAGLRREERTKRR